MNVLKNAEPEDGIRMVTHSLKAFWFSLGSLIPIIGIPFIAVSLSHARLAARYRKGCWNPAGKWFVAAAVISGISILFNTACVVVGVCCYEGVSFG